MSKKMLVCIIVVLAMLITGCAAEEEVPRGVIRGESGDSYIVKMPTDMDVKDYFALTGERGCMHMSDEMNLRMDTVDYSEVEEGGWVIYAEDLFLYVPYELSERGAQYACVTLAQNVDNYMTYENAKEYIKVLK